MLEKFGEFVKKNKLFSAKSRLLLALSGGEDSVCLFHLLKDSGYKFAVAHCNFQLRGVESDKDEHFVRQLAGKHGIQTHCIRFETTQEAEKLKMNIQETARFLRYQWFDELCHSEGYSHLLTAHHLDDNTETMLINLSRGTGIAGLHGIPMKQGSIRRPLLYAQKSEITEYLQIHGHKYRLDESNLGTDYLRNKLRHKVIPQLKTIDRQIDQAFSKTANLIHEFEVMSRQLIREKWESLIERKNQEIFLPLSRIASLEKSFLQPFLYESLRFLGFTRSQTDKISSSDKLRIGFRLESHSHQIVRERDGFAILALDTQDADSIRVEQAPMNINLKNAILHIDLIERTEVDFSQLDCLYADAQLVRFPLNIRAWKDGDRIIPLGMKGRKLVSDVLTDKKIPHALRKHQKVIVDSKGELIAILPHTISDVHKVRHNSIHILRFNFKNSTFVQHNTHTE